MKKYAFLLLLFLFPGISLAHDIIWYDPLLVNNLGFFAEKMTGEPNYPDIGYYEDITRTYSVATVINSINTIGEILLMIPNLQPYRGQERVYVFRTATGSAIIRDISNELNPKWFIKTPSYIQAIDISSSLKQIQLPNKISITSIGGYFLEYLSIEVKEAFSTKKYEKVGTFYNTKTRKNEPLYTETSSGSANGFYVKRRDSTMALYMPHLTFLSNKPQIIWDDRKRRNGIYVEQDSTVCGSLPTSSLLRVVTDQGAPILVWRDSNGPKVEWIPFNENDLQKVGKTKTGQAVYVLPDNNSAYQIYYDKYFPENMNGHAKPGMKDFIQGKPFIFYKDEIGRYIFLLNTKYYIPMFCA